MNNRRERSKNQGDGRICSNGELFKTLIDWKLAYTNFTYTNSYNLPSVAIFDKMGRRCENRGCTKQRLGGETTCKTHLTPAHRPAGKCKKQTKRVVKAGPKKKHAFNKHFQLSMDEGSPFKAIKSIIDERVVPVLTPNEVTSGNRNLHFLTQQQMKDLSPLLIKVVSEASKRIGFPIKHAKVQKTALIIAPKKGITSNAWTNGKVHRDFTDVETSGIYSFSLNIDDVTERNGAIELWKNSKVVELDERHPMRNLERYGFESKLLLGPQGTVHVWDGRLVHRSRPNESEEWRRTLHWYVTGENVDVE
jgi:hypothetical protein